MDLYAHQLKEEEKIEKYIKENYGEVPRNRGIRFMKVETPYSEELIKKYPSTKYIAKMFNKYVGQDVIYIHTRCGNCGLGYKNPRSNYISCGAKKWEEQNKDKFLEHITDSFDKTYCTHYFEAVINDDYKEIIEMLKEE